MRPTSPDGRLAFNRPSNGATVASEAGSRVINPTEIAHSVSMEMLQAVDIQRKPAKSFVSREVRDSVVSQIRIHDEGPLAVARRTGLTLRETVAVLLEELEAKARAEFRRGYLSGIARGGALLPPNGPAVRKAA